MAASEGIRSGESLHILVIEDERKLANAIAQGLAESGYQVTIAHSGEAGLKEVRDHAIDVVLLDLLLPRRGGLETLCELRRGGYKMPVLILTSKGSIEDRVRGLDAGADDYLIKPFAFPELLARVRALHRRVAPSSNSVLQLADLRMDVGGRIATRGGELLDLTGREFDLLAYLLLNTGTVVSREMVARDVWKTTVRYTSIANVIDVLIVRIRRKIDDPFPIKLIHTVRGVGFVLRIDEERK